MKYRQTDVVPVVLIRHAQSEWNKQNRFTGWADPPLTEAGLAEAKAAAAMLRAQGWQFDIAYSSRLLRAQQTLTVLLQGLHQVDLPQLQDWRLNERHYGALQGLNKAEIAAQVGEEQVWRWRRGYHDRPDALATTDAGHPLHDDRYRDVDPAVLPGVESLADTRQRVMQFWREQAVPRIQQGQRLLISAHGNSLRALIMALSGIKIEEVEQFEIPTAMPILYAFSRQAKPLAWSYIETHEVELA